MKIRTRIFLLFAAVMGLGFYALTDWVQDDLRQRYMESLEEPLVDTAEVLAGVFAHSLTQQPFPESQWREVFDAVYRRDLQSRIYKLNKRYVDMRVYVTDAHGVVLFDSAGEAQGQDYSRWNDVYLTLRGDYGVRASRSDTQFPKREVLYVAAPVMQEGRIVGVVSVGKPTQNVERFLADAKYQVGRAAWVAALVMILFALILYRWVSRPLQRLTEYVEAVKRGERVALPRLGRNEIGLMGEALSSLRSALDGKAYIERYVQTLTHEIKSPLAAIRGAAELMDEGMAEAERRHFLRNILNESARAQRLVDDLLELSSLESRMSLQCFEPCALNEIGAQVVADARPLAQAKSVHIETALDTPLSVQGDPILLARAFSNLLANAIAFSSAEATVVVRLERSGTDACFCVEDRGSGIPAYAQEKIFERFFSLQRPDSGDKSSGLGLTLVKEIAQLHEGSISLENRPGGGVSARLTLPLASAQHQRSRA